MSETLFPRPHHNRFSVTVGLLIEMLQDPDESVVLTAIRGLKRLGTVAKGAVEPLKKLANGSCSEVVQNEAGAAARWIEGLLSVRSAPQE